MRVVLLLLILVIAVSGCASSGVNMYSMPTQKRVIVQAERMQTDMDTLPSFRPVKNNKQITKARKKSPPTRKTKSSKSKRKGKGQGILGSILGATVELAKVAIKTYGQKLPKIPGF